MIFILQTEFSLRFPFFSLAARYRSGASGAAAAAAARVKLAAAQSRLLKNNPLTARDLLVLRAMNPRECEFRKIKKLGAGSFGTVWLVQRKSDGLEFALKEIDLRKPGMHQVMKEIETMTKLPQHPNIVQLHDHWMSADRQDMWLLLQYCSRGPLSQLFLASRPEPDDAMLDLGHQLLQALCVFERNGVVHNDIKPDNVFIMDSGVPKVGDLGLARFTTLSVLTTSPGGTPLFQSPEVLSKCTGADGKPVCFPEYAACKISYESDVYSLGVLMWSLIMRRYPDRSGGASSSLLTPSIVANSKLRTLVNDMLQPDPALRPRASKLVKELVSFELFMRAFRSFLKPPRSR